MPDRQFGIVLNQQKRSSKMDINAYSRYAHAASHLSIVEWLWAAFEQLLTNNPASNPVARIPRRIGHHIIGFLVNDERRASVGED